jgi:hypothetical protein
MQTVGESNIKNKNGIEWEKKKGDREENRI